MSQCWWSLVFNAASSCVCVWKFQRICCLSSWVFGFCNVDSQYCHSADCDVIGRVRKQRLLILDPLLLDLCSLLVIKTTRSVDKRAKDNNLFCFIAVATKVHEKHASFFSFLQIKGKKYISNKITKLSNMWYKTIKQNNN